MAQDNRNDNQDEVEFSVTDLRPPRSHSSIWQRLHLDARKWRWVAVGLSLALALAVVLSSVPTTHNSLARLVGVAFPSPTPTGYWITGIQVDSEIPTHGPIPVPLPTVSAIPQLGRAPASCPEQAAKLQAVGPGPGKAIGGPKVWLGGFTRTYPTIALGDEGQQTNNPFGWSMHYTQYGWPAPITLVRAPTVTTEVTVSGLDPQSRQPLWFAFAAADGIGLPVNISSNLTLDPNDLAVPSSGNNARGTFWNGYIFLPQAGCYQLYLDIPGTSSMWQAMISAGR